MHDTNACLLFSGASLSQAKKPANPKLPGDRILAATRSIFQAKIGVMAAPDHGMKVIGRTHFIHRAYEQCGLQIRNKLIGSSMYDKHRRFVSMHIVHWAR
jgi:hypothetical protein